jgi:hypothetical protein
MKKQAMKKIQLQPNVTSEGIRKKQQTRLKVSRRLRKEIGGKISISKNILFKK